MQITADDIYVRLKAISEVLHKPAKRYGKHYKNAAERFLFEMYTANESENEPLEETEFPEQSEFRFNEGAISKETAKAISARLLSTKTKLRNFLSARTEWFSSLESFAEDLAVILIAYETPEYLEQPNLTKKERIALKEIFYLLSKEYFFNEEVTASADFTQDEVPKMRYLILKRFAEIGKSFKV